MKVKRILSILLAVSLVLCCGIVAYADDAPALSVSTTNTAALKPGDTITYTVSLTKSLSATSGGFAITYDTNVFECTSAEWLITGAIMAEFNLEKEPGVTTAASVYMSATAYSGNIATFTLTVKENAAAGNQTVSANPSFKNGKNIVTCTGTSATVEVSTGDAPGYKVGKTLWYGDVIKIKYLILPDDGFVVDNNVTLLVWEEGDITDGMEYVHGTQSYEKQFSVDAEDSSLYSTYGEGIYPKRMGDKLIARVCVNDGKGNYTYGDVMDYNPVTYAKNMLASETSKQSTKDLVTALVNFGAAAQVALDYKTNSLMNSFLGG